MANRDSAMMCREAWVEIPKDLLKSMPLDELLLIQELYNLREQAKADKELIKGDWFEVSIERLTAELKLTEDEQADVLCRLEDRGLVFVGWRSDNKNRVVRIDHPIYNKIWDEA